MRLYVPERLRAAVGKREVHRSTGCRDFRLAKIVATEIAAHWHKAVESLARMDVTKIRAGSVDLLGVGFVGLSAAADALGASPRDLAERLHERRASFYVMASGWAGWAVNDIYSDLDHERDELGQVNVVIDPVRLGGLTAQSPYSGRLQVRFPEEAVAATQPEGAKVCQFLLWPSTERGFVLDLPGETLTAAMLQVSRESVEALRQALEAQLGAQAAPVPNLPSPYPAAAPDGEPMRFSELAAEYLRRESPKWRPDQARRRAEECRAFQELMGDLPLVQITRPIVRQFGDRISELPDRRDLIKKAPGNADLGFVALVEIAKRDSLPRLTVQSQRRMLDGLAGVLAWAETETYIAANPAKGLGADLESRPGTKKAKAHDQRDAFSDADLQRIFSVEWFLRGVGKRTAQGRFYSYRPHYYWLPLLALYTGGRLNELSQLYLKDMVQHGDVWCADFNLEGDDKVDADRDSDDDGTPGTDKSLKTANSERVIPLHRHLLELGLMDYVKALKSAGHARLFPELKHDRIKGYGKAAGKWFNDRFLGQQLSIARDGRLTFHSLRHNYATALGALSVPTNVKSDLMGHSRGSALVDSRYDKGASVAAHKEIIDRLDYSLPDIARFSGAGGLEAIKDALELKRRHKP